MKLLIFIVVLKIVEGVIQIDVNLDENRRININFLGYDKQNINQKYIDLFGLSEETVKSAVEELYGEYPREVYLKKPTSWFGENVKQNFDEVSTMVRVKSTKIKSDQRKTIHLLAKDFENSSTQKIKVNAALTQTVENSVSISWVNTTVSETTSEDGGFSVEFSVLGIPLSVSFGEKKKTHNTSTSVFAREVSEKTTLGSTSGVEIELDPGRAVTAVLSASKRAFEVEIEYERTLTGALFAEFGWSTSSALPVDHVQEFVGLIKSITYHQTLTGGVYYDESIKVYDRKTGLLLLQ